MKRNKRLRIANIRNERENIMTDPTNMRLISVFYRQFYTYTFDNLYEMKQFLENHKFTQDDINNLSSPITL